LENQTMLEIQKDHYIDNGCNCIVCRKKRLLMMQKIMRGEKNVEQIKHDIEQKSRKVRNEVVFNNLKMTRGGKRGIRMQL
jgi:hypothetical protein